MGPRYPSELVLAVTLLTAGDLGSDRRAERQSGPPVRHIDHIMIRTDQPRELFGFFTETLKLPVAWPLAERGGVTSGGAGFGNVNVEAIRFPSQTDQRGQARLVGFAFKPSPLRESLAELARRGITYWEPRPFVSTGPGGTMMTFFTNVTLQQFSDSDRPADATMHIFLSEYNPAYVDADRRRARLRTELAESGGGPLGVRRVQEVIVGTTDPSMAGRVWGMLLEPTRESAGRLWTAGDGPAIRLVAAGENVLQGLVIGVASLRRARAFLQESGLLDSASETELTIAPSKIQGLSIRLVEVSEPGAGEGAGLMAGRARAPAAHSPCARAPIASTASEMPLPSERCSHCSASVAMRVARASPWPPPNESLQLTKVRDAPVRRKAPAARLRSGTPAR